MPCLLCRVRGAPPADAEFAGVSTASVSRVLTGARRVTPEVAAAVLEASARLGFRANTVARALRVNSTRTVGLVVPNITNPFFPALVQAIEVQLRNAGRGLLLADSLDDVKLEAERVEELLDRQVDGLLVSPCDRVDSRDTLERASARASVVQIDRRASSKVHFVGMNHIRAISQLVAHLRATGREALAFLGASPSNGPAFERRRAYVQCLRKEPSAMRVLVGSFSFEWGVEGARRAIGSWPEVDAIVCANDLIALGAIYGLSELGIDVPGRVAVTGFDDCLFVPMRRPTLTTVHQPLEQMAAEALGLLSATGAEPIHVRLSGSLVGRESTAPATPRGRPRRSR